MRRTDILSRSDTFAVSRNDRDRDTLPCHDHNTDLDFAATPAALDHPHTLCAASPVRAQCLDAALEREEPWGVWGGEIIDRGVVVARKRPRGRPRKNPLPEPRKELVYA